MKKMYKILLLSIITMAFLSCGNKNTPNTSELDGKTFNNGEVQMQFNDGEVTYSLANPSPTANARSALTNYTPSQKFTYEIDEVNKTIEFNLTQVWNENEPCDYETALNQAKAECEKIEDSLNDLNKSITEALAAVPEVAEEITKKIDNYYAEQEALLTEYLDSKYNSIIFFAYELNNELFKISEKFKDDLTDASSKFFYTNEDGNIEIILNDYDNLIPFSIKVDGNKYIGVPEIDITNNKISIELYNKDINYEDIGANILESLQTKLSEVLQGNTTADSFLSDSGLLPISINFSYEIISEDGNSYLKLKLENTPNGLELPDTEFTLTYTPVLAANLSLTEVK